MTQISKWLVMILAVSCNGCITASLATLGTVFGAAGSAASAGSDAYHLGKLEAALNCPARECHRAVLLASIDLGLRLNIDQRTDKPQLVWEITLLDDYKSPVGVHIEDRSAHLCLCRVDVGFFGSEATARLFIERVRAHLLPHPATTPA